MKLINELEIVHCGGVLYSRILHKRVLCPKKMHANSETDVRKILNENCILFMRKWALTRKRSGGFYFIIYVVCVKRQELVPERDFRITCSSHIFFNLQPALFSMMRCCIGRYIYGIELHTVKQICATPVSALMS